MDGGSPPLPRHRRALPVKCPFKHLHFHIRLDLQMTRIVMAVSSVRLQNMDCHRCVHLIGCTSSVGGPEPTPNPRLRCRVESRGQPVHKLNGAFVLNVATTALTFFGAASLCMRQAGHVLTVSRVTLDHHGFKLKSIHGDSGPRPLSAEGLARSCRGMKCMHGVL